MGLFLSTTEEIQAVYQDDIDKKSYIIESRYGKKPFYDNFAGMAVRKITAPDPTGVENKK